MNVKELFFALIANSYSRTTTFLSADGTSKTMKAGIKPAELHVRMQFEVNFISLLEFLKITA